MLTTTTAQTLYGQLTNQNAAGNLSFGLTMINEGISMMMGDIAWPFLELTSTLTTVASQQFYNLPANLDKLFDCTITVGTIQYHPEQVTNFSDWNYVNATTGVTSDNPSYFFIQNGQIGFWPIPATSSLSITLQFKRLVRDLSVADYTSGTITSITSGASALVGNGTSWTTGMAGKMIKINNGNAANLGDGLWYPITTVGSGTTITLGRPYVGTSIAAGTATYTIGDTMIIPERYQKGPVYYAVAEYWMKENEPARSDRFRAMYSDLMEQMREDAGKKTTDYVVDDGYLKPRLINPNFNNTVTG